MLIIKYVDYRKMTNISEKHVDTKYLFDLHSFTFISVTADH